MTASTKVERCPRCTTMKAAGSRYHAAMLRERDNLKCKHGAVYWSDCAGRIPPPCCWGDYKTGPTGATPRDEAQARLAAFEAARQPRMSSCAELCWADACRKAGRCDG